MPPFNYYWRRCAVLYDGNFAGGMMRLVLSLFFLALSATVGATPRVFVSVMPLAWLVEQVGGQRVEIESLLGPGQNPAVYDPTPRQIARLAEADLFVRVGVPYETGWLPRLRATNPGMRVIDAREGLPLRLLEEHAHGPDGERGNDVDPHVWTDPLLSVRMAARIRDVLTEIDPEGASGYAANFREVATLLEALDKEIRELLANVSHRKFLVFHPAWGYYAAAYGLQQVAIEQLGKEPGPQALARVIDLARAEELRVILVQRQFSRKSAMAVAEALGARVAVVDPLARDYPDALRQVTAVLAEALR